MASRKATGSSAEAKKRRVLPEQLLSQVTAFCKDNPKSVAAPRNPVTTTAEETQCTNRGSRQHGRKKKDTYSDVMNISFLFKETKKRKDDRPTRVIRLRASRQTDSKLKDKFSDVINIAFLFQETKKRTRPARPTHFIGLRLMDEQVRARLCEAQQQMLSVDPKLRSLLIAPASFHLTLGVFYLTQELMPKMCDCLDRCAADLRPELSKGLELRFQGVGRFGSNVVFAAISEGDSILKAARELIIKKLADEGIFPTDGRPYNHPHLTLMKSSRGKYTRIPAVVTKDIEDMNFGTSTFVNLQLCNMRKQGDYYKIEHSATFSDSSDRIDICTGASLDHGHTASLTEEGRNNYEQGGVD